MALPSLLAAFALDQYVPAVLLQALLSVEIRKSDEDKTQKLFYCTESHLTLNLPKKYKFYRDTKWNLFTSHEDNID